MIMDIFFLIMIQIHCIYGVVHCIYGVVHYIYGVASRKCIREYQSVRELVVSMGITIIISAPSSSRGIIIVWSYEIWKIGIIVEIPVRDIEKSSILHKTKKILNLLHLLNQ